MSCVARPARVPTWGTLHTTSIVRRMPRTRHREHSPGVPGVRSTRRMSRVACPARVPTRGHTPHDGRRV
eukprot:5432928-Alexandrium_andersonii.AAC.1